MKPIAEVAYSHAGADPSRYGIIPPMRPENTPVRSVHFFGNARARRSKIAILHAIYAVVDERASCSSSRDPGNQNRASSHGLRAEKSGYHRYAGCYARNAPKKLGVLLSKLACFRDHTVIERGPTRRSGVERLRPRRAVASNNRHSISPVYAGGGCRDTVVDAAIASHICRDRAGRVVHGHRAVGKRVGTVLNQIGPDGLHVYHARGCLNSIRSG